MPAELNWTSRPTGASSVVLVLPGGQVKNTRAARWHDPSALRMVPVALAARAAGRGAFAVARLQYAVRGWNAAAASPLVDARAAMDEIEERYPGLPVMVVGHSMGGRVALALAADRRVRGVLALAPWIERSDRITPSAGVRLLLVHGLKDPITSAALSRSTVARLQAQGAHASFVGLRREGHAMLLRAAVWDQVTTGFLRASIEATSAAPLVLDGPPGVGARAWQEQIVETV